MKIFQLIIKRKKGLKDYYMVRELNSLETKSLPELKNKRTIIFPFQIFIIRILLGFNNAVLICFNEFLSLTVFNFYPKGLKDNYIRISMPLFNDFWYTKDKKGLNLIMTSRYVCPHCSYGEVCQ